ncbi:reactive chlorine resistance membrane protein RclC [Flavobacterium sp. FlaQc-30]|uniref:reactive chlorine resistance membrane protein RclC n=1 Tax=Flavobacterium sp. FlaQc-30 TaxID=3374179 RepID=UPI003757B84F
MKILIILSKLQGQFINFMRIAILIVMVWIGGLKAFQYEADGIVPFVANSPLMSFFYNNPQEYKEHKNKEGEMVQKNIEWNHLNGTYGFSYALGTVIVIIGSLTFLGIFNDRLGLIGGLLTAGMALVTLTFLITTPETWVPNLGGDMPTPQFGFPYLSGAGRLVVKDIIMMAGGLIVASDSAKKLLKE